MTVFKAIKAHVEPLQYIQMKRTVLKENNIAEYNGVLLLTANSYNIPECITLSKVQLVNAVRITCVDCMVAGDDVISVQTPVSGHSGGSDNQKFLLENFQCRKFQWHAMRECS